MIKKILEWIPKNLGALVGIVQAIVLFIHEVCVLALRVLCPIIPSEKDDNIIKKVQEITDKLNGYLQILKNYLVK